MDKPFLNTIMTDADADRWIYDRIDYERVRPRKASTHFRLERVERLLSVIGSPQKRIPAVHIAGTKGKGSTAAILDSILTCSGIRSGLFTSPHLHQFSERMRVNGRMPDRARLTSMVADLQQRLQQADPEIVEDGPTYFEVATLLGWMYFDQEQVEVAVLETGLGGRLVRSILNGQLAEVCVEAVGHKAQAFNDAVRLTKEHGDILYFGVPPIPVDGLQLKDAMLKNLTIRTSLHPDFERTFPLAMQWLAEKRVDLSPLLTHRYPLAQIQEAFDLFRYRREGAIKVLVEFPANRGTTSR